MQTKLVPNFKTKQERLAFWYPICQAKLTSTLKWTEFCTKYKISKSPVLYWIKYFKKHPYHNHLSNKVNSTIAPPIKTTKKYQSNNSAFLPVSITKKQQPPINIKPSAYYPVV